MTNSSSHSGSSDEEGRDSWLQALGFTIAYWMGFPVLAFMYWYLVYESRPGCLWRDAVLGPIIFPSVMQWSVSNFLFTLFFVGSVYLCIVRPFIRFSWERVGCAFIGTVIWLFAGLLILAMG